MPGQLETDFYRSPEEYLVAEIESTEKHEYLAGVVYAMAGASLCHIRISDNIRRHLGNQLSGGPCEAFSSDIKVRIRKEAVEFFYYPDVTVDCSSPPDTSHYSENPRVIFEVLSKETERIDRGEKLQNYQTLDSLSVYVLIDQAHVAVTVYRRVADTWETEFFGDKEDAILLPEIECSLPLSVIYERTELIR